MAEFPALPLFTDAFIGDTLHLNPSQIGAYMLMLMTAWRSTNCSLPNDDSYLSKICRMDKRTWLANKDILLKFWHIDGENILQKRLRDERKYVEDVRNKNVAAGKASALKRKERHSTSVQPKVNEASTPTPTPIIEKDNTNVLSKKISLEVLSVDHISVWLMKKRSEGKYINHDEHFILEKFKDYCLSKGKKYHDYAAAYRNAFNWDSCQPKQERLDPASTAHNAAKSIIARRNAAAGLGGGAKSTDHAFATNLCLPENLC